MTALEAIGYGLIGCGATLVVTAPSGLQVVAGYMTIAAAFALLAVAHTRKAGR